MISCANAVTRVAGLIMISCAYMEEAISCGWKSCRSGGSARKGRTSRCSSCWISSTRSGRSGKITRAAAQAGISYRHGWNLVEKWSAFFEAPLVERQQGRGTTLTPFGERLVWAGAAAAGAAAAAAQNLSQELEIRDRPAFLPQVPTHHPGPRQPRLRGGQAAGDAGPRGRRGGRSPLRQQPDLARLAGPERVRPRRHASAAGRTCGSAAWRRRASGSALRAPTG